MGNNDVKSTGQYALRHLFYDNDVVFVTYTLTDLLVVDCWNILPVHPVPPQL